MYEQEEGRFIEKKRVFKEREKEKKAILKMKMSGNENRRLRRRNEQLEQNNLMKTSRSPNSSLLEAVSPGAKKRANHKLKLTTEDEVVRKQLKLDTVRVSEKQRKSVVTKIEKFMLYELKKSVAVPDKKVKMALNIG